MPSLYIHIPFCEKKCMYCDFFSLESTSSIGTFLTALHREIVMSGDRGRGETFETIFFGGGTPSLLTPVQLDGILSQLHAVFSISSSAEVTLETNPGTVTPETLRSYRRLGVNRLSIGVQSLFDDELKFLGRIHDSGEAEACVRHARDAGFENVSIDMIYSLPGQTLERWKTNLARAVALAPDHVSAYSLIVEEHTPLSRLVNARQVAPNPPEAEADLYEWTMGFMAGQGFDHYEVSNYARPGFHSVHNSNYWNHKNYLGFGPSAHSFWRVPGELSGRRWWNIANLSHYCDSLGRNERPHVGEETVASEELATESIFLGLRSDGLNLEQLRNDFGVELRHGRNSIVQELVRQNLATLNNDTLRLTSRGFLLCDEISGRLMG